jgi:hypothetical protein
MSIEKHKYGKLKAYAASANGINCYRGFGLPPVIKYLVIS